MCDLPCPLPVSHCNWSLLPEGLAMWVGDAHCCSPQSVPGEDYQWFGAVGEGIGKVEEAGGYQAGQCPQLWFFQAGKASKPTGWN